MAFNQNLTTIATLNVPAGNFVITAKGVPYIDPTTNSFNYDTMRCDLYAPDSSLIDQAYSSLTEGTDGLGSTFADDVVTMVGAINTSGGTISMQCLDADNGAIMFRNQIAAIQVGSVTGGVAAGSRHHAGHGTKP